MNRLRLSILMLAMTSSFILPSRIDAQSASRFFPAKDLMTVGVYYYPEHWPQEQWERDFAKMEAMGFEFVHMGEFAWAMMEPEEGRFDFAWLIAQSSWPRAITCECCCARRLRALRHGWEKSILKHF